MKASHWSSAAAIAAIGLALGLTGIGWGLPSARRVELLGSSIEAVRAELSVRSAHDLEKRRGQAAILATQPAEEGVDLPRLVRRYLLFSDSPDEPLTLLALANFRPRQLDFNPRMVEYGGLHVYGTGAAMALAHAIGFGRITNDVMHYADHPEDIARLYIAGRFLMVIYNIAIALALFVFGRSVAERVSVPPAGGSPTASATTGILVALLWLLSPPSLAFSHIINPHLPAAFWGTLAVWLAWRAGRSPNRRAWLGAAAASGAAASCALNAWLVFLALALVAIFAWRDDRARLCRELGLAALVAVAMFLALNPYFLANLGVLEREMSRFSEFRRAVLGVSGIAAFVTHALGSAFGLFGIVTAALGMWLIWKPGDPTGRAVTVYAAILLLVGGCMAGTESHNPLCIRFAFCLLPLLCVSIALVLTGSWPQRVRAVLAAIVGISLLSAATVYLASFHAHAREEAGTFINRNLAAGASMLVPKSPGPYEMPAFDFSRVRLVETTAQPHGYAIQVENQIADTLGADYEPLACFPKPGLPRLTALSFSGRFVRVYRCAAVHQ